MIKQFFSSLSVRWKLILATGPSLVALCLFAAVFVWGQIQHSRQMEQTLQATLFSASLSDLVHELQKERGRTAGFVASEGGGEQSRALEDQKSDTDTVLAEYRAFSTQVATLFHTEEQKEHFQNVGRMLEGLDQHRNRVGTLMLSVSDSVSGYTEMVDALILLVHDELNLIDSASLSQEMQGLIKIMRAKEAAGLERAQGNAAFSSSEMSRSRHQTLNALISQQNSFFEQFNDSMSAEWRERLSALRSSEESNLVETARSVLVNAGYGGDVTGYTSSEWFEMTTSRIDQMKAFENELVDLIATSAASSKASADFQTYLTIFVVLLIVMPSLALSFYCVNSIVGPMRDITDCLERLAEGDNNVEITGRRRGDEIGVLARSASAFLEMSIQREQLIRDNARQERDALSERRTVMSKMANEVEAATQNTVAQIVAVADTLSTTAARMQSSLASASENAETANQSSLNSLEDTQKASELANELNAAIGEVAHSIVKGDQLARDTVEIASQSRESVEELNEATQQIGDFVRVITELAEQTNLLALNATIESARAGEHGKGFAVVASEIKQLAAQTNRSASEITDRVEQIQARTSTAVGAINRISDSINTLGDVTSTVAAAVEEQRASTASFTEFLNSNRSAIEAVAGQVAGLVDVMRESAGSASEISDRVGEMADTSREASQAIPEIVQRAVAAADNRQAPRTDVAHAVVRDISTSGARIGRKSEGEFDVELPGNAGTVRARTAWSNDKESGVAFEEPLNESLMGMILGSQKTSGAA